MNAEAIREGAWARLNLGKLISSRITPDSKKSEAVDSFYELNPERHDRDSLRRQAGLPQVEYPR